MVSRRPCT